MFDLEPDRVESRDVWPRLIASLGVAHDTNSGNCYAERSIASHLRRKLKGWRQKREELGSDENLRHGAKAALHSEELRTQRDRHRYGGARGEHSRGRDWPDSIHIGSSTPCWPILSAAQPSSCVRPRSSDLQEAASHHSADGSPRFLAPFAGARMHRDRMARSLRVQARFR